MSNLEYKKKKHEGHIVAERINFLFLADASMIYDYEKFDDHIDALIDAVNKGEDLDDMISLIYQEKIDQPIVKQKILKIMNNASKNK